MQYQGSIVHLTKYCLTDNTVQNHVENIRDKYERNSLEILFRVRKTHKCIALHSRIIHTGTAKVYYILKNKLYCEISYSFSVFTRTILYSNNYYNAARFTFKRLPSAIPIILYKHNNSIVEASCNNCRARRIVIDSRQS